MRLGDARRPFAARPTGARCAVASYGERCVSDVTLPAGLTKLVREHVPHAACDEGRAEHSARDHKLHHGPASDKVAKVSLWEAFLTGINLLIMAICSTVLTRDNLAFQRFSMNSEFVHLFMKIISYRLQAHLRLYTTPSSLRTLLLAIIITSGLFQAYF